MAQGHIIKALEQGNVHTVQPAHRGLLALADSGPGHELVGHQQAAVSRVPFAAAQDTAQRVGVALGTFSGFLRPDMPDGGRLQKREQVDVHRAVFVGEGDGLRGPGEHRAHVYPALRQQVGAKRDAVGGIVVAADGEHRKLPLGQRGEEPVQQADGLGGGHGLIVKVARQQHSVHGVGVQQRQNLLEDIALVVQHGKLTDPLAEVEVREVKKAHGMHRLFVRDCLYYSIKKRACPLFGRHALWIGDFRLRSPRPRTGCCIGWRKSRPEPAARRDCPAPRCGRLSSQG